MVGNIFWFFVGLVSLLLSFWSSMSKVNSFWKAVRLYWTTYQRIAIFNLFGYLVLVAYWFQYGIGSFMKAGQLTVLVVPLAWGAGTFFHIFIKNFASMLPRLVGNTFGVKQEDPDGTHRQG